MLELDRTDPAVLVDEGAARVTICVVVWTATVVTWLTRVDVRSGADNTDTSVVVTTYVEGTTGAGAEVVWGRGGHTGIGAGCCEAGAIGAGMLEARLATNGGALPAVGVVQVVPTVTVGAGAVAVIVDVGGAGGTGSGGGEGTLDALLVATGGA